MEITKKTLKAGDYVEFSNRIKIRKAKQTTGNDYAIVKVNGLYRLVSDVDLYLLSRTISYSWIRNVTIESLAAKFAGKHITVSGLYTSVKKNTNLLRLIETRTHLRKQETTGGVVKDRKLNPDRDCLKRKQKEEYKSYNANWEPYIYEEQNELRKDKYTGVQLIIQPKQTGRPSEEYKAYLQFCKDFKESTQRL